VEGRIASLAGDHRGARRNALPRSPDSTTTAAADIAAALLGDPPVLLLDEPVNGLDPEGVLWIRTLIRGLAAEGRTVLVSSHLMSEMALTADRLTVHIGPSTAQALTTRPASSGLRSVNLAYVKKRSSSSDLLGGSSNPR
jgi:ABC-2 type transport system ATP-binding protein